MNIGQTNGTSWKVIGTSEPMRVMPSNNGGLRCGYLCAKYPGRVGWLISPNDWKQPPSWMPYALDNGAFGAWKNKQEWDEGAFWDLLERTRKEAPPLWAVVPDVVADRPATLAKWSEWEPKLRAQYPRLPLAFAVQDGMTQSDVPSSADLIFVGGSTEWKWKNLRLWTENFERVHVARVGSERMLWMSHEAGAESCDGTGWFRDPQRTDELERYLRFSTSAREHTQMILENVT